MRFFCYGIAFIRKLILIILISIIIVLLIFTRCNSKKLLTFNECNIEEFIIRKGTKTDGKVVSFACKLDWGHEHIDTMLNLFDKYGVKITFFTTGRWAVEHPGIVQKLHNKGHEIGNCGFTTNEYDKLSYENAYEDIKKADTILRELTGESIKLFSPPSGVYNSHVIKAAVELGYPGLVLYSIDTMDWKRNVDSKVIQENILNKLTTYDIILIHPTIGTAEALGPVIQQLLNDGYKIVTVSEMLKK
jgi:peptidoglycan/xylan/chitin deacetylase (PgdA/CDA1 family)